MLFYLTDTLIVQPSDDCYTDIIRAVHNIALQAIDGRHMLLGNYKAITFFRNVFKETFSLGQFFNRLYQNYSFLSIPSELSFYIEVVKDNPNSRINNGIEIRQKSYSNYVSLDTLIETRLICEDLSDTKIYRHILTCYLHSLNCKLNCSFQEVGGGGDNTDNVVRSQLEKHHITICIVDTDRKFKDDVVSEDSTCGKCSQIENVNEIYKFLPLDVHEIENLIPLNYIDKAFPAYTKNTRDHIAHKKAFDFLRKDAENILPYFDYKKGIKKNELLKVNINYRNFAKLCYSQNDDFLSKESDFDKVLDSLSDKGEVYPGLIGGTGVVSMTLELIDSNTCPEPELLDFQRENWKKIGESMLNWCVCSNSESLY